MEDVLALCIIIMIVVMVYNIKQKIKEDEKDN